MTVGSKPKGLQAIRSISGLVTELSHPHRKFLKLAILAMEQARRSKERASAQSRIETIDARLAEIKAESNELLQVCGAVETQKRSAEPVSNKLTEPPRRANSEFKLKY